MGKNPKHYFMAAVLASYVRQDEEGREVPKQRHLNVVLELGRKAIAASDLKKAQIAVHQRLADESNVEPGQVKDMVFLGLSYLGHMAPEDFHDIGSLSAVSPAPKH